MLSYSVAIRTLGLAGEAFRAELESIARQSVRPERVVVYIAEGYARPDFEVMGEEYVWVEKGMVKQRALRYEEIQSDCLLLLDDDVLLEPDSVERMLRTLEQHGAGCVAADTFRNQDMTLKQRTYAALTNWVLPHRSQKWAFKIHPWGSFSYNSCPSRSFYWSESAAGPASLWRKEAFLKLRYEEECWLDQWGYAYGDDALMFYKAHLNGCRLGVLYDAGVKHLNAASSSSAYKQNPQRAYVRTIASFATWHRLCFHTGADTPWSRLKAAVAYSLKALWLLGVMAVAALWLRSGQVLTGYVRGLRDGLRWVRSTEYRNLQNYCHASM